MQVWYRTVSLVTSSKCKQQFVGKNLLVTLRLVKNFRGWRLTTKIMKLNQPRKFLRIRYLTLTQQLTHLSLLSSFLFKYWIPLFTQIK